MARKHSPIQIIGTVFCLVYAVVWVVAWFDRSQILQTLFDSSRPRRDRQICPAGLGCAAVRRRAADAPGHPHIADLHRGRHPGDDGVGPVGARREAVSALTDALVWLILPLAIAVWVFGPPLTDAERAALPPLIRTPDRSGTGIRHGRRRLRRGARRFAPPDRFIVNLGFGDIVVPRYAAIAFGLCCALGGFVSASAAPAAARHSTRGQSPRSASSHRRKAAPSSGA